MSSPTVITLRYEGPDVNDGTMPINEVAEALKGFSGAYTKIATHLSIDSIPQLRVTVPRRGSWEIAVLAIMVGQYANQLQAVEEMWDFARHVFHVVTGVMNLKKFVKGKPYGVNVQGNNNTITIVNIEKLETPVTRELLDVFQRRIIDNDVEKIVDPLHPDRINKAELLLDEKTVAVVTTEEKQYFRDTTEITEKPDEASGRLISLNKQNNRGTFEMQNGRHIPYHFVGQDKDRFHSDFAYKGPVRVSGSIEYDQEKIPVHVKIERIERLQDELPF